MQILEPWISPSLQTKSILLKVRTELWNFRTLISYNNNKTKIRSLFQWWHYLKFISTFFADNNFRLAFLVHASSSNPRLFHQWCLVKLPFQRRVHWHHSGEEQERINESAKSVSWNIVRISVNRSNVTCSTNNHELKYICVLCHSYVFNSPFKDGAFLWSKSDSSLKNWLFLQKSWRLRVTRRLMLSIIIIPWLCLASTDPWCQVKKSIFLVE